MFYDLLAKLPFVHDKCCGSQTQINFWVTNSTFLCQPENAETESVSVLSQKVTFKVVPKGNIREIKATGRQKEEDGKMFVWERQFFKPIKH